MLRTVLGLSVTPHGIAWALIDGHGRSADVTPLDDDAFDLQVADEPADRAAAAARGAQAIAAASGQDVAAIGVSWPGPGADDAGTKVSRLIDLLAAAGFDDVRVVDGRAGTDGSDLDRPQAQLRDARTAAYAVATNAVAPARRSAGIRPPASRKHRSMRAVAAAAAAVATGLLTVGSQFVEPAPAPAVEDGAVTADAAPRLVTVASPQLAARLVTTQPAEMPVSMQVADRAVRAPAAEAVEISVPAAAVTVPHLPAGQPHPQVAEPHMAVDPSPGPALAVAHSAAAPSEQPGLWLLDALP